MYIHFVFMLSGINIIIQICIKPYELDAFYYMKTALE